MHSTTQHSAKKKKWAPRATNNIVDKNHNENLHFHLTCNIVGLCMVDYNFNVILFAIGKERERKRRLRADRRERLVGYGPVRALKSIDYDGEINSIAISMISSHNTRDDDDVERSCWFLFLSFFIIIFFPSSNVVQCGPAAHMHRVYVSQRQKFSMYVESAQSIEVSMEA